MEIRIKHKFKWVALNIIKPLLFSLFLAMIFTIIIGIIAKKSSYLNILTIAGLVISPILVCYFRRDALFVNRIIFTQQSITLTTIFKIQRIYDLNSCKFIPKITKRMSTPKAKPMYSFYLMDLNTGKNIREYDWDGFSVEDFSNVQKFYGYNGQTDFKTK